MISQDLGDPASWANGQQSYEPPSQEAGAQLAVFNESPYVIVLQINGITQNISPWLGRLIILPTITYQISLTRGTALNSGSPPISDFYVECYAPGEPIAEQFPITLVRQANIGNSVAVTNTQAIVNDGNAAGTSIIEATPASQGASSWALNNDASGFLQVLSANVLRKILNVVRGNTGAGHAVVDIGDTGDKAMMTYHGTLETISSDVGTVTSDGSGNVTAKSLTLQAPAGNPNNDLFLKSTDGTGESAIGALSGSVPFFVFDAIGGDFVIQGSKALFAITGAITNVGRQATVGNYGVPMIVAQAIRVHVTSTAATTILTYTPGVAMILRVNAYVSKGDATNNDPSLSVNWKDPDNFTGVLNTQFMASDNFSAHTPVNLDANNAFPGDNYAVMPLVIAAQANQAVTVVYTDPSGTVSDFITAIIERLA